MKEIEIHFKGGDGKRIKTLPEVPDNNDYVDLSTPQDIDGKKNFIQTPTINGKDIATQEELNEVSNSKQNTLTAGNGVSIENDTISVTDAGGLTVLKNSDFPLSADLLAKVNANPQNYCILWGNDFCVYSGENSGNHQYKSTIDKFVAPDNGFGEYRSKFINPTTGGVLQSIGSVVRGDKSTVYAYVDSRLSVKGVRDTTDDSVKTGTEIRKAITIRKWH